MLVVCAGDNRLLAVRICQSEIKICFNTSDKQGSMSVTPQEKIRVLHVDDEPEFADLTTTLLEREDDRFTVETATSASDGLAELDDSPPDCIVSDYNMPGMDGLEFLEAVRAEYPALPFILFTGRGSEEVASDAISAGATDYLQKGSGTEQYRLLANRIENAVRQYRSEERLDETQKEYTAVFENAQNALLLVNVEDNGFRYQQCNPRAAELIGRDRTEIVGSHPSEALGPENGPKVVGAYRKCVHQRESVAYTVTLDLPMGRVIWDCEATPVASDGDIEQLVVEFRDVTEQYERLRELREYETIIEALTDAVYVLDEDGRFTYVNEEFVELVGYDRETILGNTPSLIKDEEAVERAEEELGRLLSSDGPDTVTFEVAVQPRDWDPIICRDHMGVLPYEGDRFNGSVGTLRNITDEKERQRELEQIETLFQHAQDSLFLIDVTEEFTIEWVNPAWENTTGLSAERVCGQTPRDVLGEEAGAAAEANYRECIERQEPLRYEEAVRFEGELTQWVTQIAPVVVDGRVQYIAGSTRNVTEQRER
jgi:PAS domain S-box-containing protein